jgi:8-oxo-dGTP pyrophosphatase MutT (NUDIX family)
MCAKIHAMNIQDINDVVAVLRTDLEPLGSAHTLVDISEGPLAQARKAAVLLGLFEQNGQTSLLFIRRSSTLRAHSGEIAFPGGGFDPTDSSLIMTALREAEEEVGLNPARTEVLGILPPVFTVVSNYLILPVVAFLPAGVGTLQLQASEVSEVIIAPLFDLMNPAIFHTEEWVRAGRPRTVYFYDYGTYRIWGATARILNALLDILTRHE